MVDEGRFRVPVLSVVLGVGGGSGMCGVWSRMLTYVYRNGKPQMGSPMERQGMLGCREKEGVPTWPLRSPPSWEVPAGRGGFITPLARLCQKTTRNKNLEGGRTYVQWGGVRTTVTRHSGRIRTPE